MGTDRAEIVAVNERVHETSAIEKGSGEHKWYAAGVGPVRDAEMLLVEYSAK